MMGIQDYDCPQESVLIDTHEGYVLSDRKKTRKRKIAQFINLLLIGLGRPLADIFCKVIPHPGPIPNCLAVDHWSWALGASSLSSLHPDPTSGAWLTASVPWLSIFLTYKELQDHFPTAPRTSLVTKDVLLSTSLVPGNIGWSVATFRLAPSYLLLDSSLSLAK